MAFKPEKPSIHGETPDSLGARLVEAGHPRYRVAQIFEWLYPRRVASPEAMTNLPANLRAWLGEHYDFTATDVLGKKTASDVTQKVLQRLRDGSLIETVIIRAPMEGVGQEQSRRTICISTQVGCAYGCKFCASGLEGWKRDLSVGEIVSQLVQVCRIEDQADPVRAAQGLASFDNIVVMGMGEPLANYEPLLLALRILNAEWGLGVGARRITTVVATPSFYRTTSMAPSPGRIFTEEEGVDGKATSAILSHALWQREFGGAADVVGKDLRVVEDLRREVEGAAGDALRAQRYRGRDQRVADPPQDRRKQRLRYR